MANSPGEGGRHQEEAGQPHHRVRRRAAGVPRGPAQETGSPVSRAQTWEGRKPPGLSRATPLPHLSQSELSIPLGRRSCWFGPFCSCRARIYNEACSPDHGMTPRTLSVSASLLLRVWPIGPPAPGRAWGREGWAGLAFPPACLAGRGLAPTCPEALRARRGRVGRHELGAGPPSGRVRQAATLPLLMV